MDLNIDEIEKNFIKYRKHNIILTGQQVEVLDTYNIDYQNCQSVSELIALIERFKDDNNYDDLDWVQMNLAEYNYYHNTNK